jgi:hypothetical protein
MTKTGSNKSNDMENSSQLDNKFSSTGKLAKRGPNSMARSSYRNAG